MFNKNGKSNILTVLFILLILAYAGYIIYQYANNSVLEKQVETHFSEGLRYARPVKDVDGTLRKLIDNLLESKDIDEDNFECIYTVEDGGSAVNLDIKYKKNIDWIFQKTEKEYHINTEIPIF